MLRPTFPFLAAFVSFLVIGCASRQAPGSRMSYDTSSAAQASSAEASEALPTPNLLSADQQKDGFLYASGGGALPFQLYHQPSSQSGAVYLNTLKAAEDMLPSVPQERGGKITFIASGNAIGIYDLAAGTTHSVPLAFNGDTTCLYPGQGPAQDVFTTDKGFLVISKHCDKDGQQAYVLQEYSLEGGSGRVIADLSPAAIARVGVIFDHDHITASAVRVKSAYVDAGNGLGKISDVNLRNGTVSTIAEVSFQPCDAPASCDSNVLRDNRAFEKYFPWTRTETCGPWKIEDSGELTISRSGTGSKTISPGTFVACFEE